MKMKGGKKKIRRRKKEKGKRRMNLDRCTFDDYCNKNENKCNRGKRVSMGNVSEVNKGKSKK